MVKPYILDDLTCSMKNHVAEKPARIETFSEHPAFTDLVGESPAMLDVKRQLWMYSASDLPVFITGESGTGKELAARIVHRLSKRCEGPFIAKNCAAIPSTLFETEVFGSERGAFTDAVSRPGSFELADGGSLFLDEIGELAPQGQAKLLRALENSSITRVGGSLPRNVDTRLVSATNRKLLGALIDGSFREDLFYRINTLQVSLPPLRDRPEDIPLLAVSLLNGSGIRVSNPALEKLMKHPWPGNVRELRNVLERGMLLAGRKEIQGSDIGFTIFS
ncbi:MAG: sigma-54-dependent Fis family transcriptional regulator [Spirochaetales bacterium]|nr:sigma-54-dependent Fis family transcriptional regulator [Spirochaetales bacterium]